MNNKQLFDLTSPPSAEFDTAQELLWYCNNHAKQNDYAVATKNSKERKISQANVILEESPKKFENIQLQKKDKHHPGSTIVNLIQKPVLEEPAMEGTSNADPVSLNNSFTRKEELWFVELVPFSLNNSCG